MTQVEFGKLLGMLASLESSTSVVFENNGLVASLNGRCSPYKSHQTVEFQFLSSNWMPTAVKGMLRISGNREILIGGAYGLGEEDLVTLKFWWPGCRIIQQQVPSHLLQTLLRDAQQYVGFQQCGPLVTVIFPIGEVASWGDDGKPTLVDPDEAMAALIGISVDQLDRELEPRGFQTGLNGILSEILDKAGTVRNALRGIARVRHLWVGPYIEALKSALMNTFPQSEEPD
jgi:hypothetical protein